MGRFILFLTSYFLFLTAWANAQDLGLQIGRETHLPIPRYVSIKASEANMRIGPGEEYRIEWIYHLSGLPVKIIAESGNWRKIEDFEGVKGWVYQSLLSGRRTVLITADKVALNTEPNESSNFQAILGKHVIANLRQCSLNWCEVDVEGNRGWLPKSSFWGVDPEEIIED